MIFLFTDFGGNDLYVGQVKAAIFRQYPLAQVIDLLHDAPAFDPRTNAHLLAALTGHRIPEGAVVMAVVDAGVGGERQPIAVQADGRWYVGPDNGLLSVLISRAETAKIWKIVWQPPVLSNSFHGRDLFAPVAAMLAQQKLLSDRFELLAELRVNLGAADMPQIIYIDHYGNAMTGLRSSEISTKDGVEVNGKVLKYARVFSEAAHGEAFWYENSIGLVEVAVNCGSASQQLGLAMGDAVQIISI